MASLRVLLLSPLSGKDLESGDTSYTDSLLAQPPPGVIYANYVDALAEGTLVERGRKPRHGGFHGTDLALLAYRGVERMARRRALFIEGTWFLTVDPSATTGARAGTSRLPPSTGFGSMTPHFI